ncbi:MAG: hypothetical protein AAF196_19470 [Planctomycetota bacterium]
MTAVEIRSQEPSSRRPDAPYDHLPTSKEDFRLHRQTVYARALVDDYRRRVGGEVLAESISALDLWGRRLADSGIQNAAKRRLIAQRVSDALDAGETDLAIRFAALQLTAYEPRWRSAPRSTVLDLGEQAAAILAEADELGDRVAPFLKIYIVWIVLDNLERGGLKERAETLRPRLRSELVAMAHGPSFDGVDQPYYLEFRESMDGELTEDSGDFIAALKASSDEPNYSTLLLAAEYRRELAWEARGTGPAAGVGRRRFQTFQDELDRALELATEAYELQPELPNAPAKMVGFLGPIGKPFRERKKWFDRATKNYVDYDEAFNSLYWFEVPRWGGSPRNLLGACEDWAELRVGSRVHRHVGAALRHLAKDIDPVRMWKNDDVQEMCELAYEALLVSVDDHDLQLWYRSMHAATLAFGGRLVRAREVLVELDGEFASGVLEELDMDPEWFAENVVEAEQDARPPRVLGVDNVEGWESTIDVERPLPNGTELPLAADFIAENREWFAERLLEEFDRCGGVPESATEKVRAFLEAYPRLGERKAKRADLRPLVEALESMLTVETDDALVLYTTSRVLEHVGRRPEAEERLMAAVEALRSSGYGPFVRFLVLRMNARMLGARVRGSNQQGRAEWESARALMQEQLLPLAEMSECQGENARKLFHLVVPLNEVASQAQAYSDPQVIELLEAGTVDPWYAQVIAGTFSLSEALASPLILFPEANRVRHVERCQRAESMLTEAHRLRPEWPEAATSLIRLSTVWNTEQSARDWLELGMRAEFDYDHIYRIYLATRKPDFGGSIAAMFGFAVELLRTQRYDTSVPAMFPEMMWNIGREIDYARWTYASPDAQEAFEEFVRGLMAADDSEERLDDVDRARVAVNWSNGEYDRAIAAWKRLDYEIDSYWATLVHSSASEIERDLKIAAEEDS